MHHVARKVKLFQLLRDATIPRPPEIAPLFPTRTSIRSRDF
jgi:hypothetical protein